MLLTTEVVPKIFPNLNVVAHLVEPAVRAGVLACRCRKLILSRDIG